jgi:transcriptional regulator with XRE-family HTH domain
MGYVKVDGARLRHLRERRLMSLRDLSKAAGVAIYTISAAETGKRPEGVQPRTVHKLAKALFVMPEELLLRVEEDDH